MTLFFLLASTIFFFILYTLFLIKKDKDRLHVVDKISRQKALMLKTKVNINLFSYQQCHQRYENNHVYNYYFVHQFTRKSDYLSPTKFSMKFIIIN